MNGQRNHPDLSRDTLDEVFDVEDDARVESVLRAVGSRLSEPPDEFTSRRHIRSMHAARPALPPRVVVQRSVATAAAAVALVGALAAFGSLPAPAQQVAANVAEVLGIELQRPPAVVVDATEDEVPPSELPALPDEASPTAKDEVPDTAPPSERAADRALERTEDRGLDPSNLPTWLDERVRTFDRPQPQDDGPPAGTDPADGVRRSGQVGPPGTADQPNGTPQTEEPARGGGNRAPEDVGQPDHAGSSQNQGAADPSNGAADPERGGR